MTLRHDTAHGASKGYMMQGWGWGLGGCTATELYYECAQKGVHTNISHTPPSFNQWNVESLYGDRDGDIPCNDSIQPIARFEASSQASNRSQPYQACIASLACTLESQASVRYLEKCSLMLAGTFAI